MIKLKSLDMINFMSFEKAHIDFDDGLYFISGDNQAGGDSNGSGKSAILSAICWAVFGKTQTGLTSEVQRWGSKGNTLVGLKLLDGENEIAIMRSLNGNVLKFFIKGEETQGLKSEVQAQILKGLGTDFLTFISCDMFTSSQVDFLADSGDAAKKKLFKAVLGLEKLDKAYKYTKERISFFEGIADSADRKINLTKNALIQLDEEKAKYLKLTSMEDEDNKKRIEYIQEQTEMLKPDPFDSTKLNALNSSIKNLEGKDLPSELEELNERYGSITSSIQTITFRIDVIESRLKELNSLGAECPTCGSEITEDNKGYKALMKKLPQEHKELVSKRERLEKQANTLWDGISIVQNSISELENLKKERLLEDYKRIQYDKQLEVYKKAVASSKEQIDKILSNKDKYGLLIKSTEEKIEKLIEEWKKTEEIFESSKKDIDYWGYLNWLFSRQGVVGYIVDRSFKRLETLTNRYLKSIAKEDFSISISPQKELKSGEFKEEIEILVFSNDQKIKYDNLSSGQKQRINIATLMAIYMWVREIGSNPFDFLLLDEVLDLSLAEKGQEDVCAFIGTMLREISQIVVISHRDGLQSENYKEIHVTRGKDGISIVK